MVGCVVTPTLLSPLDWWAMSTNWITYHKESQTLSIDLEQMDLSSIGDSPRTYFAERGAPLSVRQVVVTGFIGEDLTKKHE